MYITIHILEFFEILQVKMFRWIIHIHSNTPYCLSPYLFYTQSLFYVLSLSLSHALSLSLSLSPSHAISHSLTRSLSLVLPLSFAVSPAHSLSLALSHSLSLLSLSLTSDFCLYMLIRIVINGYFIVFS